MRLSERRTDEGLLVAVCDSGIVGETFEDGEVSLTVTEEFYGDEEADPDAVAEALAAADVANIVGTEAVDLAVEHGFVDEAHVLDVDGTRHAQVLRL